MLKHTQSQWVARPILDRLGRQGDYAIDAGEGQCIGEFFGDDAEAKAQLAAAAPDLLEALKDARGMVLRLKNARWSEIEGSDEEWTAEIDAAIAKAEGKGE